MPNQAYQSVKCSNRSNGNESACEKVPEFKHFINFGGGMTHLRNLTPILAGFALVATAQTPVKPPATRKLDVTDTYFGVQVPDPYRWLEDDNSLDTKAWVKAQNEVTEKYLSGIPERSRIRERMTNLWNYERYSAP